MSSQRPPEFDLDPAAGAVPFSARERSQEEPTFYLSNLGEDEAPQGAEFIPRSRQCCLLLQEGVFLTKKKRENDPF